MWQRLSCDVAQRLEDPFAGVRVERSVFGVVEQRGDGGAALLPIEHPRLGQAAGRALTDHAGDDKVTPVRGQRMGANSSTPRGLGKLLDHGGVTDDIHLFNEKLREWEELFPTALESPRGFTREPKVITTE